MKNILFIVLLIILPRFLGAMEEDSIKGIPETLNNALTLKELCCKKIAQYLKTLLDHEKVEYLKPKSLPNELYPLLKKAIYATTSDGIIQLPPDNLENIVNYSFDHRCSNLCKKSLHCVQKPFDSAGIRIVSVHPDDSSCKDIKFFLLPMFEANYLYSSLMLKRVYDSKLWVPRLVFKCLFEESPLGEFFARLPSGNVHQGSLTFDQIKIYQNKLLHSCIFKLFGEKFRSKYFLIQSSKNTKIICTQLERAFTSDGLIFFKKPSKLAKQVTIESPLNSEATITAFTVHPSGKWFVLVAEDKMLRFIHLESGKTLTHTLEFLDNPIRWLAFRVNHLLLRTVGPDRCYDQLFTLDFHEHLRAIRLTSKLFSDKNEFEEDYITPLFEDNQYREI